MVFSQTDANPQSLLKVVELNRLKNQKVNNDTIEAIIGGGTETPTCSSPLATPSSSEIYLKQEPLLEDTMFHELDSELIRDLEPWCVQPTKAEAGQIGIDDKKNNDCAHNTDTLHTPFSPQSWELFDAISPGAQPESFHYSAPSIDPLSPYMDNKFMYSSKAEKNKMIFDDWELESLPVLIGPGALAAEETIDFNPCPTMETYDHYNTHNYTNTNTHKMLITEEDSYDGVIDTVIPSEVENNNVVISEYILKETEKGSGGVLEPTPNRRLTLNVTQKTPWPVDIISTPEVLNCVEQLETEKYLLPTENLQVWPIQPTSADLFNDTPAAAPTLPAPVSVFEEHSLKTESNFDSEEDCKQPKKRKWHDSEDSDETYTPHIHQKQAKKTRRKKSNIPIEEIIRTLQDAQPEKPRRGRPPSSKRVQRVSSVCSGDDNSSTASTHELKYREIRDKNNEASKRSRMNRKLKELQMEQLAVELEERNKTLKVKADILEDMTKRLKEALMTAILQKRSD